VQVPGPSQLTDAATAALKSGGWPVLVLLLVLWQVVPKIDHGISIADHVDSTLGRIEQTCALQGRP
jgi:hypothetical protein